MRSIEEQEMRGYLLGSLSPELEVELKARLRDDVDFREQLLAVEAELCDQFVAGSLSVDEQQRFESRVLMIERGQQELHFAALFAKYRRNHFSEESFAGDRVPAPETPVPAHSPLFGSFHRNPAFTILMIVMVGLLVTLFVWTSRAKKSRPVHIARPGEPSLLREVTLTPSSLRPGRGITHVAAPPKDVHVKLLLEITKSDFSKYKTQLFRENQALDSQHELKTEARNAHYVVPVTFVGEILTPGNYELKLSGVAESGRPEVFIDNYPFRVTQENVFEATESDSRRDQLAR